MRNTKNIKKTKLYARGICLLFCTIIGSYGIIKAPDSDYKQLEQQLRNNELALQSEDNIPDFQNGISKKGISPASMKKEAGKKQPGKSITVIGDSVFLGAAPSFKKLYKNAVIDAKISRQVCQGLDIAKKLDKKNKLGDTVIISLGTNGNFNSKTGQELINYLGEQRSIYWIDAYGKELDIQQDVNKTIRKLVKKNSNVHLIAWSKEGRKHPNWFYQDGIHLNAKGQTGFCRYVRKSLNQ